MDESVATLLNRYPVEPAVRSFLDQSMGHYIGGELVPAGDATIEVLDPHRRG